MSQAPVSLYHHGHQPWPTDSQLGGCFRHNFLQGGVLCQSGVTPSLSLVAKLCPTLVTSGTVLSRLLSPSDSPGKNMEWVAISFSRGSSQARNQTRVSCTAGRLFTNWVVREAQSHPVGDQRIVRVVGGGKDDTVSPFGKITFSSLQKSDYIS